MHIFHPKSLINLLNKHFFFFFTLAQTLLKQPSPSLPSLSCTPPFFVPRHPPIFFFSTHISLWLLGSLLLHRAEVFAGDFHAPSVESVMAPSALHSGGLSPAPWGSLGGVGEEGGIKRLRKEGFGNGVLGGWMGHSRGHCNPHLIGQKKGKPPLVLVETVRAPEGWAVVLVVNAPTGMVRLVLFGFCTSTNWTGWVSSGFKYHSLSAVSFLWQKITVYYERSRVDIHQICILKNGLKILFFIFFAGKNQVFTTRWRTLIINTENNSVTKIWEKPTRNLWHVSLLCL